MAWPVDKADGDVLTAAHVNAIKTSVYSWQGDVFGNAFVLRDCKIQTGANSVVFGSASIPSARVAVDNGALGAGAGSQLTEISAVVSDGGSGMHIEQVFHRSSGGTGHGAVESHIRRRVDSTLMGYVGFGSSYVSVGFGGGIEQVRIAESGHFAIFALPASNPGAGSKRLWYDPAAGNVVKFAA